MSRLYLSQNHGRDLLRRESLLLAQVLNLHFWVALIVNDLEGPGLNILLDGGVIESSADKAPSRMSDFILDCESTSFHEILLDIENGVGGVHGSLVLCRLSDQALFVGEGNEGWSSEGSLLVGDCSHEA